MTDILCKVCNTKIRSDKDGIYKCEICGSELNVSKASVVYKYSSLNSYNFISNLFLFLLIIAIFISYLLFYNEEDNIFTAIAFIEIAIVLFLKLIVSVFFGIISIRSSAEPYMFYRKNPDMFVIWGLLYFVPAVAMIIYGLNELF